MEVWHIRTKYGRAFANPKGIRQRIVLLFRGWTPFNEHWWSKPCKKLAERLNLGK